MTSPGAHTHAEKTVSLANTYLTDKLHTHSTLQAKPDLSLQKRHLHDTLQPLLQTICETKQRLKDRFNEHCRPVDNPSNISKPATV